MRRLIGIILVAALLVGLAALPVLAAKPSMPFPPGKWKGKGVWTGAISGNDVGVTIVGASVYDFELNVDPEGNIDGLWTLAPTKVNVAMPEGESASGVISGMGGLAGNGAATVDGTYTISITIPSVGVSGYEVALPAEGSFWPTSGSCTFIQGDLANQARESQQAAGFATSVVGPFTAKRIAAPGDDGTQSWDESYVELVEKMTELLGTPNPSTTEVLALVIGVDEFTANLVKASVCNEAPSNLEKGKQPYTWFIERFTELMNKILDDPSAYSGADIAEMLIASVNIGAVGSAAPDSEAAAQLKAKFEQVLNQKLDDDIAKGDKVDAVLIYLAAAQAGLGELATKAHGFAF